MPAYDYVCDDCAAQFEIRMSISSYSDAVRPRCTTCGSENTSRTFGAVNVLTGGRGGSSAGVSSCGPTSFG